MNRKPNIIVYPANTVMANGNYHAAGSKVAKQIFEKYRIAEVRIGIDSQQRFLSKKCEDEFSAREEEVRQK